MSVQTTSKEPHRLLETYSSLRVNKGAESMPQESESVADWFERNMYGTRADLTGFKREDVEEVLDIGEVKTAPWPTEERRTDFFWKNSEQAVEALSRLATEAADICLGKIDNVPANGSFQSIVQVMGEGRAVAGLAFAVNLGMIREVPDSDIGKGHLYVAEVSPYNADDQGVGQKMSYYRVGEPGPKQGGAPDPLLEEARQAQEERPI